MNTEPNAIGPISELARSEASRPFWEGIEGGRLLLPWCLRCQAPFFFPRRWCPSCHGSEIAWREARGTGTVWAHTSVHRQFDPDFPAPYVVLLIALDEGVRVPGNLDDPRVEVAVGDRVELDWSRRSSSGLPLWRRVGPGGP